MDMSMGSNFSPSSSPRNSRVAVVDWGAQNRQFEIAESHPKVDERTLQCEKNEVVFQSIHNFRCLEKPC